MSFKSIGLDDDLHAYLLAHNPAPDPVVADLIAETRSAVSNPNFQIAPEQAPFLTLLVRLIGARTAVEVGTYTGLSSIAIARGLPADGHLLCLDISDEYTSIARRFWERAGLTDRIELRLAPASDTLAALPDEPRFDFAFIDANKSGYVAYWEAIVPRMRPGGLIVVDNVLRGGHVLNPEDAESQAIVDFNRVVLADDRTDAVMTPVGDGLTLARRR